MKIVYVYPQFAQKAGTERVLIDKMNYLSDKAGYEIVMLTFEQGSHPLAYPLSSKVRHVDLDVCFYPLYSYNRLKRFLAWRKALKLLHKRFNVFMDEYRPDIVVAITYSSIAISLVVDCPVRYVRVLESHIGRQLILSNDPENQRSLFRWVNVLHELHVIEKKARKCNLLVALSHDDANDWSRFLKTIVITNVVHLNPKGRSCTHNNKNIIFVGRYVEQKGIFDLFKIWCIVNQKHPDWHLHLYGRGNLEAQMLEEANRLKINIHVHHPDHQIFDRYLECSIVVLTSLYESFGLVLPEAMSCGLPAVAFDCPSGPADIITDGFDGYLIGNRNIQLFADRLCQLIEHPDLRRKMGNAAMESSQRFSADRIMKHWMNLFEDLVAKSS